MSFSEKYIFLANLQMTLDKATRVCTDIENESKRMTDFREEEDKENTRTYTDECPVCYEKLSNRSKVLPMCGHEICLSCYADYSHTHSHDKSKLHCVMCRRKLFKK